MFDPIMAGLPRRRRKMYAVVPSPCGLGFLFPLITDPAASAVAAVAHPEAYEDEPYDDYLWID